MWFGYILPQILLKGLHDIDLEPHFQPLSSRADLNFLDNTIADIVLASAQVWNNHREDHMLFDLLLNIFAHEKHKSAVYFKALLKVEFDALLCDHLCVKFFYLCFD